MIPAHACFEPEPLKAANIRLRAARFAADPAAAARGVCVLLNGQTEFIEKYFEVIDELRQRGFCVVSMDWRGQGGSGGRIEGAPLKAYIGDFAEYDEDLRALMDGLVAPLCAPGARPIALAHSMGGHILLRALHRDPGLFAAAAFSAPMLMFSTRGRPRWLAHLVTRWAVRSGHATDFVWGIAGRDPLTLRFDEQIVTSDRRRFERTQQFLSRHPDLRLAGPTWGWLAAAYRSTAQFETAGFGERITTPMLICGAGHDRVCVTAATRAFAARTPNGRYLEIAGAEHEILMERDILRARFWTAFDDFMATHAGQPSAAPTIVARPSSSPAD